MSLKKSASFIKSSFTSFLPFCPKTCFSYLYSYQDKTEEDNLFRDITNATKKRATMLDEFRIKDIQDLLTAIRSVKWLPAERTPMNSSIFSFPRGGVFSSVSNSRFLCAMLG